ncbi:bifunctional folylpolyglutamate synthase/dihydrofolate synthase [Columbia Basin potato purple top phytoplasma]|uniref:Bifunctional folylpolyglutamate synthase/dihydrofolate synthase n=1 Tax=Columbia Basin potato purple top phytoplasma TaxID=307134 RepID=A0ABT5LAA8_9MOLU|nr:Mur ligase family protein [Columbia Basin potato purple top phytoplasma]MDC9032151.1 bifunctional folylpolyglutamate synthase/dihydrofolate synthase [Columbia Basin potato purple top phytoplasma]
MKNKKNALFWLHNQAKNQDKIDSTFFNLYEIKALLKLLNNPEKKIKVIHVAGTNGKGSTVYYLNGLLQTKFKKVGIFVSPHIEIFNERIQINSQFISDDDLVKIINKIRPLISYLKQNNLAGGNITYFEILTVIAFEYFYYKKTDICVIEVGLGGELDSTNVVEPILTAITTIGRDHERFLGHNLKQIALKKAGIIKYKIPIVTGNISNIPLSVICAKAKEKKAIHYKFKKDFSIFYYGLYKWHEYFDFRNKNFKIKKLKTPLIGYYQPENASMAIQIFILVCELQKINFTRFNIIQGLQNIHLRARMEKLQDEPLIFLDGAHNVHSIKKLVQTMNKNFINYKIDVLFTALKDKNILNMLKQLTLLEKTNIYLSEFEHLKSLRLNPKYNKVNIHKIFNIFCWQNKVKEFIIQNSPNKLLLIVGSLYFASQVRHFLMNFNKNE